MTATAAPPTAARKVKQRAGDRIFAGATRAAGYVILVALAGVAIFLTVEGIPAFSAGPDDLAGAANFVAYVWPLLFGTLLAAVARPADRHPARARRRAGDLALRPAPARDTRSGTSSTCWPPYPASSTACGASAFLGPRLAPVYAWLADHLGFIPFFAGPASATGRTILTAAIVLAIMVLPIITAITREIFAQTPTLHQEAALALGATRWEMLRLAVFPYARSGIVSAVMLGLGRALGETMAVAMVLSASGVITFNLISTTNPSTIAANIALGFPEATGLRVNALIASGLVLFVITFAVNFAARSIVGRRDRRMA